MKLEAPPGFEPGMEVLQTSALPLGDGAGRNQLYEGRFRPRIRCGYNSEGRSSFSSAASILTGESTSAPRRDGRQLSPANVSESWSGKRDSNPRLRPWQGRTLPLSYSRSPRSSHRTTGPSWRQCKGTFHRVVRAGAAALLSAAV